MPWHQEPTKDVVNCEKPWGAVSKRRSMDIRMGKPGTSNRITVTPTNDTIQPGSQ